LARYAIPAFELEAEVGGEAILASWAEAQRQRPWVTAAKLDGRTARLTVSDVSAAKHALLPAALEAGLVLTRYEMLHPSLEDIFLRLVGEAGA
jgi:ABC-2 type transport system ATP-binding protein